jgi:hypothetical protein
VASPFGRLAALVVLVALMAVAWAVGVSRWG